MLLPLPIDSAGISVSIYHISYTHKMVIESHYLYGYIIRHVEEWVTVVMVGDVNQYFGILSLSKSQWKNQEFLRLTLSHHFRIES